MVDDNGISVKVWTDEQGNVISTYYVTDKHDNKIVPDVVQESTWSKMFGWLTRFTPYAKQQDLNDPDGTSDESLKPKPAVEIGIKTTF